jgi:hypothetical protein
VYNTHNGILKINFSFTIGSCKVLKNINFLHDLALSIGVSNIIISLHNIISERLLSMKYFAKNISDEAFAEKTKYQI